MTDQKDQNTNPKSTSELEDQANDPTLFKDMREVDEWKNEYLDEKNKVILQRDGWKSRWLSTDKKCVKLEEENNTLRETIEEMERKDLGGKKFISRKDLAREEEKSKQQQLNKFLNRIK